MKQKSISDKVVSIIVLRMSCPFMARSARNTDISELPELSLDTVSGLSSHSDKVNLVVCCGFIFDVTSDSSFNSLPLSDYLFKDVTETVMKLQLSTSFSDKEAIDAEFERMDGFSKMQMKSNLLRLFCDKYKTVAKLVN